MDKKRYKLSLFGLIIAILLLETTASAQWVPVNDPPGGGSIDCFAKIGMNLFGGGPGEVVRSTDNGISWNLTSFQGSGVEALAVIGTELFAGGPDYGVFKSTDSGTSWTSAKNGIGNPYVHAFASISTNIFAGSDGGVLLSSNYGTNWNDANIGMESSTAFAFAVNASQLFAGTHNGKVFRSSDTGTSWQNVSSGLSGAEVEALAVLDSNLFAGTVGLEYPGGIFHSTDNGKSWTREGLEGSSVQSFTMDSTNLFAGTDRGVFLSTNNGIDWTAVNSGLTDLDVHALAISGNNLIAGTSTSAIWWRPLSEMIAPSAVTRGTQPVESSAQAHPNPFPEKTSVQFTTAERGPAQVTIVNLLGQQVARLFNGELDAGEHSFEWNASGAAAGTYFAIVREDGSVQRVALSLAR